MGEHSIPHRVADLRYPTQFALEDEHELESWTTVKSRRRRRNGEVNAPVKSRCPTTKRSSQPATANGNLSVSFKDKCYRCLARGHFAAQCRDPVKCIKCKRSCHKAWQCPSKRSSSTQLPAPPPPPPCLDLSNFPPLVRPAMASPGDPSARPTEEYAVASSTRDMERELERLTTNAVVVWLGKDRPTVGTDVIKRAFCTRFAVRPDNITVAQHFPEDFFVDFKHHHHRDAAVELRDFPYGNLDIRVRPWQLPVHGDSCDLKYHVRLCLEGIPLHAWNESIAKRVVASSCDLHYVEEQSLRREDTRALNLWAWTKHPSHITKVTWLTLTGKSVLVQDGFAPPAGRRRGLTFRVIVHLDLVEDPPGADGRAGLHDYKWHYGVVDGERTPRDRHDPAPADHHNRRHHGDDDDDDYRRGRRDRKSDNWSSRLFRSLSRAPKERERERSESRHGHRGDRSSVAGGRRHRPDEAPTVDESLAALNRYEPQGTRRARTQTPGGGRGRSPVRRHLRRPERRARSAPRTRPTVREDTPDGRLQCKPFCSTGGTDKDHRSSPRPPKVEDEHIDRLPATVATDVADSLAFDGAPKNTLAAEHTAAAGVASLFAAPTPPVLQPPPPTSPQVSPAPAPAQRRRQRRVFDMSSEFLGTFTGTLPADVVAALSEWFNLNDAAVEQVDNALLGLVGEGVDDLQETGLLAAA
ncbi:unnamed protein product [Urochloa humidicola]